MLTKLCITIGALIVLGSLCLCLINAEGLINIIGLGIATFFVGVGVIFGLIDSIKNNKKGKPWD